MSRRSDRHRADKYQTRAAAMLDSFHWQREEEFFLGLMETGKLSIQEIRDLTWSQIRDSYDGLLYRDSPLPLRESLQEGIRETIQSGKGLYGEPVTDENAVSQIFSKETLKHITKELDQFKDV